MFGPLTAQDLWPLVERLPYDEQVRLAKLALHAAARGRDSSVSYVANPPNADELGTEDEPLAWDGEGWRQFDASR